MAKEMENELGRSDLLQRKVQEKQKVIKK